MRYYINGKQVTSTQAKDCAENGYLMQGGDPVEFAAVWEKRDGVDNPSEFREEEAEEARDMLAQWSGYTLEILTDEEDETIDE